MTEERKHEMHDIAQALRCISTPFGGFEGSKCRFWQEEAVPEELRHEVGDKWGSCDCDRVGMAGADAIQELLSEVERLEEENMVLRIKMHGDCGVCAHKNAAAICVGCLLQESRPCWKYEGSSLA